MKIGMNLKQSPGKQSKMKFTEYKKVNMSKAYK